MAYYFNDGQIKKIREKLPYINIARNCTDNEKRYLDEDCVKVTRDLKQEIERLFGYRAEAEFRFAFEWEEISYPPYTHKCPYSVTLYRRYLEAKIDLSKPIYKK